MKKRLFITFAIATILFFVGGAVANAADVELGGQFRPRFEAQDRDFDNDTDPFIFIQSRIRLNTKVTVDDDISAFFQLQSIPMWGVDRMVTAASDSDASIGIHQAYVTLGNLFGFPVALKAGRQEVIYDGHRIVGNTGWTAGAVRHDALRLDHFNEAFNLSYVFSKANENGTETGAAGGISAATRDDQDIAYHIFHGSLNEILGGKFSLLVVYTDDDFGQSLGQTDDAVTAGFRQAGNLMGLNYRVEFYYQAGSADACFDGNCTSNTGADLSGVDRQAFMAGGRIGHKFEDFAMQPSITLWYDYLSGDDDATDSTQNSFWTLLDTGHKFYGFMDRFVNVGRGSSAAVANSTQNLGLQDIAAKISVNPMENLLVKADIHAFYTAKDVPADGRLPAAQTGDSHLGEELDLTLVHRYSDSTTMSVGYSHFFATTLMQEMGPRTSAANADDANWAYVMLDFKF